MARSAYEVLESRNSQIVRLLDENRSVSGFIQALVEHLVDYANHRGVSFRDIEISTPHIGDDAYLRARILTRR